MSQNPLLTLSLLRNHAPQFDLIREEHFEQAVNVAIMTARTNVDAIVANPDAPTFDNTIVALETAAETLGVITGLFYNQLSAAGTDGLQALAGKIGPVQANFGSDVIMNAALFARVKAVYDARAALDLTVEQKTLLDDTYKNFVRGGALLDDAKKARLRAINEEMSVLGPNFANNVKKSAESFELWIEDAADLDGLPQSAIDGAKHEATDKGHADKWLITLDYPSFGPFITYSKRRALRELIWKANSNKAFGGEYDNTQIMFTTLKLRHERAQLLGYDTHAHFVLERRMAETPEAVMSFLHELRDLYKPAALQELAAIKAFAKDDGVDELMQWDVAYYAEKLREKTYAFSAEDLRPYFPLDRVLSGTFAHFEKLFGLKFAPAPDLPVWHADVSAYEVFDSQTDAFVGTFYADFYPRAGKKPGAWMTTYRDSGLFHGKVERPIVAIVCNFTKPTQEAPSLLTHDEVLTLFHEMGHATHALLAKGTYMSLTGTNVLWDFVELPSQLQENWLYEADVLNSFARHYKTGEPLPPDLIRKLNDSKNFDAGWMGVRLIAPSILDMEWHLRDPAMITDVVAFEDEIGKVTQFFPRRGGPMSVSFNHIFAGGYSAGYYSYKWAQVLDADAYEAFTQAGLYDAATAQRFRHEILEKGGAEHPSVLYRKFRGRDADPKAVLRREGVV